MESTVKREVNSKHWSRNEESPPLVGGVVQNKYITKFENLDRIELLVPEKEIDNIEQDLIKHGWKPILLWQQGDAKIAAERVIPPTRLRNNA